MGNVSEAKIRKLKRGSKVYVFPASSSLLIMQTYDYHP